jgi:hypothetical protein
LPARTRHRRRHRRGDRHDAAAGELFAGFGQERLHLALVAGFGAQQRHRPIGRELRRLALRQLQRGGRRVAAGKQGVEQRMVRMMRLQQHFARQFGASGAARDLDQQLR